ncbi:hypothetical protein GN956_G24601 [Arapaima gigas]
MLTEMESNVAGVLHGGGPTDHVSWVFPALRNRDPPTRERDGASSIVAAEEREAAREHETEQVREERPAEFVGSIGDHVPLSGAGGGTATSLPPGRIMSPIVRNPSCFSPMLCHCKVACSNNTLSLVFGCKVGPSCLRIGGVCGAAGWSVREPGRARVSGMGASLASSFCCRAALTASSLRSTSSPLYLPEVCTH